MLGGGILENGRRFVPELVTGRQRKCIGSPLATTQSILPNSSTDFFTQFLMSVGLAISAVDATALALSVAPLKVENSSPRGFRAQYDTLAPSARRAWTINRPMPFEPPAIISMDINTNSSKAVIDGHYLPVTKAWAPDRLLVNGYIEVDRYSDCCDIQEDLKASV